MIHYNIHRLDNGLTLIHHEDNATNLCVSNLLYNVGARDENPNQTGFAHLFEHLMFGGSVNIPSFDTPLQLAGGENNAFTSNDITNYYVTLPADNIETALWLESDRMLSLDFSEKSLAVQRGVVIEEFKQRYLNQPYGDAWLKLRPLAYQVHPYQWATIGKEISHIENAKLEDVVAFFERFYNPSNAILCLAGAITFNKAKELTEKWFGDISAGPVNQNKYPQEPKKTKRISSSVVADVPQNAIYMAFNTVDRHHADYFAFDLLSDLLSGSESSRFTQTLVKELKLFTHVHSYITGDIDEGLFIMEGKLNDGVSFDTAEKALLNIIQEISDSGISDNELNKVKNKVITSNLFSKTSVLNKAMALCYAHLLGNVDLINSEIEQVKSIQKEDILRVCKDYILSGNFSVLNYQKQ